MNNFSGVFEERPTQRLHVVPVTLDNRGPFFWKFRVCLVVFISGIYQRIWYWCTLVNRVVTSNDALRDSEERVTAVSRSSLYLLYFRSQQVQQDVFHLWFLRHVLVSGKDQNCFSCPKLLDTSTWRRKSTYVAHDTVFAMLASMLRTWVWPRIKE